MKSSSGKSVFFFLGILLGVVIGVGGAWIFWQEKLEEEAISRAYALNRPEVNLVESQTGSASDAPETVSENKSTDELEDAKNAAPKDQPEPVYVSREPDSIDILLAEIDSLLADTLVADSRIETEMAVPEENIVVRKDELMDRRQLSVNDVYDSLPSPDRVDSLLANTADIQITTATVEYQTEFWRSPLNFRGYKLGKNQLLLFGVYQPDSVALYRVDEMVLLTTPDGVYRLERTDEFLPLERENDPQLLQVINQ